MATGIRFGDDEVLQAWMGFSLSLSAVALVLVVLRVYVARFVLQKWGKDDVLIFLALFLAFVCGVAQFIEARFLQDMFRGRQSITTGFVPFIKLQGMAAVPSYALSTALAKCAICFYFLRLTISRGVRIIAYATMALAVGQCLAVSMNTIACTASLNSITSLLLSQANPEGYEACAKASLVWVTTAFINSFTDLVLLVLPLWILQPLRAPWRKKLAIMGVLMGGGFVFGVSVYRAYQAFNLFQQGSIYIEWTTTALWCVVELFFGLLCACLPATKALYNHFWNTKRSGTSRPLKLRTLKLRTLTQAALGALPSRGALGGGDVVRLDSSDPTTAAYKAENFTASTATAVDTTTSTTLEGSDRRCSDDTPPPPARAHVAAEKSRSACGGECGESDAALCVCSSSSRLSRTTTFDEVSLGEHGGLWGGLDHGPSHGQRRFPLVNHAGNGMSV
ncbi:hypothetical protein RB595_008803 [Gaeumannomyces hyphopodioides]